MDTDKVNTPEGEETLAQHIASNMNLTLEEARALVRRHGNDIAKIEEERARFLAEESPDDDSSSIT